MAKELKKDKCIEINDKKKCCGCNACVNACVNACEQGCISMKMDKEGFSYPYVDRKLCINCGLCITACHMIHRISNKNSDNPDCYAAYAGEYTKAIEGSSGGIFELLCKVIYARQGIVYGASLDNGFRVRHHRASDIEAAKKFRKSKYLQSDIGDTFRLARQDLEEGRVVLFSGTPCQIGGLYGYLGKEYQNLYTVDVVCHGVPSREVFIKYLNVLEEKYGKKPLSICWRDKRNGWRPNKISIEFDDGQEVITTSSCNSMQMGFLNNLYLRPSCYVCQYASIPRIADISLGDFWEYEGKLIADNRNRGLSMVVVSNKKGEYLFENIREQIIAENVDVEYCKEKSIHLSHTPIWNKARNGFMHDMENGMNYKKLIRKYLLFNGCRWECDMYELEEFITEQEENNCNGETLTGDIGKQIWKKI